MVTGYRAELVSFTGNPSRKINAMKGHKGVLIEARTGEGLFLFWAADLNSEDAYTLRTSTVLSVENTLEDLFTYRTANSVYAFRIDGEASRKELTEAAMLVGYRDI
jgi:hypothetical protein